MHSLVERCDWTLHLRKRQGNDRHRQFEALWPYDNRLFLPAIEEYDLENTWSQQDGATCQTTRANMAFLQETFPGRIISRHGDIKWPPRSCDLMPFDLFVGLRERPSLCR